jgi:LmbE family N-acetylglucosaminyl deacetylase
MTLRLLAVAAATGRVAYVYLIGDRLMDWRISDRASESPEEATAHAKRWIETLQPDVVVTEDLTIAKRKGQNAKRLIEAVTDVADEAPILSVQVPREQAYENKYAEAASLAIHYPDLQPWVPKRRRFWDNEHRNTVLFEALALAQVILRNPTPALARSLG